MAAPENNPTAAPGLTITEAAARLCVTRNYVAKLIRRGRLQSTGDLTRRGKEHRIPESELARFDAERKSR